MATALSSDLRLAVHRSHARWASWATPTRYLVKEARPVVQFVFLLRLLASSGVLRSPSRAGFEVTAGWLLITISIYVFNGVTDYVTDTVNESHRPIAAGQLSMTTARNTCIALVAIGLALCAVAGRLELILGLGMTFLGWSYSAGPTLKSAPRAFALVIGAGAGLTYAAGWVTRGRATAGDLAMTSVIALWVGLCCAAKDFSDIEGDRAAGRRTWPVLMGGRRASRMLACLAIGGAGATIGAARVVAVPALPAFVLAGGSILLAYSALRYATACKRSDRRRPYRSFMLTQYATNLALIV